MAFTVRDFHDLVELLQQQPDWRAELRRLVLSEELLTLPQLVRELAESQQRVEQRLGRLEQVVAELAESQRRAEQRLDRLEQVVAELAESQRRAEQRLDRLEQVVAELAESQRRTEQRVAELHEAQIKTEQRVAELHEAQIKTEQRVAELVEAQTQTERRLGRIEIDHGNFKGILLEERHRQRPFVFFRWIIRRAHVLHEREVEALLAEPVVRGVLSQEQADDVMLADVVVQGRLNTDRSEVYLVVEVSWGVGTGDVERAVRRANLLAQTGVATMPVVSGNGITPEAVDRCREMQVWQLIDGRAIEPLR